MRWMLNLSWNDRQNLNSINVDGIKKMGNIRLLIRCSFKRFPACSLLDVWLHFEDFRVNLEMVIHHG